MTRYISFFFLVLVVAIAIDFILPGASFEEAVTGVVREQQQHYNASGNVHYTYHVRTSQNYFIVPKSFATSLDSGEVVEYRLSYLFDEVNGVKKPADDRFKRHSMRWFAGLIFPLIAIAVLLFGIRQPKKYGIPVFVVQVGIIADLVYLFY